MKMKETMRDRLLILVVVSMVGLTIALIQDIHMIILYEQAPLPLEIISVLIMDMIIGEVFLLIKK